MMNSRQRKGRLALHFDEWPKADRLAWERACRPSHRLKKGGSASHLALITQKDLARRYGEFLGCLRCKGWLDEHAPAAAQVTPANVEAYLGDLAERNVGSVTKAMCVYKLRRTAQLLSPGSDFNWLVDIEKDLAFVMIPRSKLDRLVMADRLVEAGLTLITEADAYTDAPIKRALGIRNGLMLALLALAPIRARNFAALEIGTTFRQVSGRWWIVLPGRSTKMRKPEERPTADWMIPYVELYLKEARPVLLGQSNEVEKALWISSRTHGPMTAADVGSLISDVTLKTIGASVSPHMFRTSVASTAADSAGDMPHLASALLAQSDPRITEEHYNRASSLNVANEYAEIIAKQYRLRSLDGP